MLSRLKRRSPSSAFDTPPAADQAPPDDVDTQNHGPPPSPTPSGKGARRTFTTPVKGTDYQDADTANGRTLSPSRARASNRTSTRSSRSSSFISLNPPDRRSINVSLPADLGAGGGGGPLLVANGPGASTEGTGGIALGDGVGTGSLTLDHLAPPDGGAPLTLVVQAPELMLDRNGSDTGGTTPTAESADMRTPVPSTHPDFDNRARGMSSASGPVSSALTPSLSTRPRSHTTSEAMSSRSSGLDALAAINVSPSPSSSRPASPHHSATTSPRSTSRPPSRSASRPGSRSSSVSQQYPDTLSLRPPSTSSPVRGRKTPGRSANGGIAGALALSGVALASPNGALRHPHGLARISSDAGDRERLAGGGAASGASSAAPSMRESIDDASSPTDSFAENDDDVHSQYGDGMGGFLSMDQLGDFDDVVSQLGTGYAVASSKRNADFHELFKNISDDDYLIEDYGCALQREILIQGRLYISEHHLSFYANIFGWVTSLTIPFSEVCSIEKRMTAYVIPNAIQVATMHARHTFASFLSRDTTYDLIGNIWRMVHPVVPMSAALPDAMSDARSMAAHSHIDSDEEGDGDAAGDEVKATATGAEAEQAPQKSARRRLFRRPRGGTGESSKPSGGDSTPNGTLERAREKSGGGDSANGAGGKDGAVPKVHAPTVDTCPTLKNLKEVCLDTVFPGKPEKIYNLMFTSGFMKDFWAENQRLTEIQISDWAPQASGSNLLARSMSYIKPLNGSIGPKQTKCMITDESAHVDFDDFVCVITTTRTPDVPSGSAFAVKTRTSMTWAKGNHCRVVVTTGVEWSKSSFIKGIIEKSCIDGQKTYHADLEKAMRAYIATHRNEFVEEGHDPDGASLDTADDDEALASPTSSAGGEPAVAAAPPARTGALAPVWDLLEPLFEQLAHQSPKTLLLGSVVAILVLSNIWTLRSSSSTSSHPAERAARARGEFYPSSPPASAHLGVDGGHQQHDHRTPHDVASAVRDVLQDYFAAAGHKHHAASSPSPSPSSAVAPALLPAQEVKDLEAMLDRIEERVGRLREELRVSAAKPATGLASEEALQDLD
ncbi:hypothetical protein JCM10213_002224 [Rhodosporidiobolus nylandii]